MQRKFGITRTWERYQKNLEGEANSLRRLLQGKTPLKVAAKDKRGWGSTFESYSTVDGYNFIQAIPNVPQDPAQWKFVWSCASIPKIDYFCWTLAHKSILTSDNLRRRGMEGPSRCPLCVSDEENTDHMLLHCSFASEVWKDSLKIILDRFSMPANIQELMKMWANILLFNTAKKDLLKASWMWLPKFIYWKLWIERNNRIFREKTRI